MEIAPMTKPLAVRSAQAATGELSAVTGDSKSGRSVGMTRVNEVLDGFALRDPLGEVLTAVRHFPARNAQFAEFPAWVQADLVAAYAAKGVRCPYTHQAAAAEMAHAGKNIVVVTPTASGKTLCYNLPILSAILENSDNRA